MSVLQNSSNFNSTSPAPAVDGGSGLSSPLIHGILVGQGASPFNPLVLGAGQVLIGTTAGDPAVASLSAGTGISIASVSGAITITNSAPDMAWVDSTSTPVAMVTKTGYTSDDGATLVVFTLPTSAAIGDSIEVQGKGAGGWQIAQAAGQQIFFGNVSSTVGTGGSIASSLQYDSVKLRALTSGASSAWSVVSSVGNISVT